MKTPACQVARTADGAGGCCHSICPYVLAFGVTPNLPTLPSSKGEVSCTLLRRCSPFGGCIPPSPPDAVGGMAFHSMGFRKHSNPNAPLLRGGYLLPLIPSTSFSQGQIPCRKMDDTMLSVIGFVALRTAPQTKVFPYGLTHRAGGSPETRTRNRPVMSRMHFHCANDP